MTIFASTLNTVKTIVLPQPVSGEFRRGDLERLGPRRLRIPSYVRGIALAGLERGEGWLIVYEPGA